MAAVAGTDGWTWAFDQSIIDLTDPRSSYTCADPEVVETCQQLLGMSVPLALSLVFTILGFVLMGLWWRRAPAFFRGRPEVYDEEGRTA